MSFIKYIERLRTIHYWIGKERTGTSEEFASRLQISRSLLMDHLREMRECFDAPIAYCRRRNTFYYSTPYEFKLTVAHSGMQKIKGGQASGWLTFFSRKTMNIVSVQNRWTQEK